MKKNITFFLVICFAVYVYLKSVPNVQAQTAVTINSNTLYQQIEGFGASTAFQSVGLTGLSSTLQSSLYDMLFSKTNGIGLTILRSELHPSVLTSVGNYNWNASEDVAARKIMLEAKNRGAYLFYSVPWTPPAWMKTNNSLTNGGSLLPQYYQAYADFFSAYVRQYKNQYGIDIHAMSIQNEPGYVATWRSCIWSGTQMHDFIKNNLYPTFLRDGVNTKIMAAEHAGWAEGAAQETLVDPVTAPVLDIVAAHQYAGAYALLPNATRLNKSVWETEVSGLGANDPSITDAMKWAKNIHAALTQANVNAWLYWWAASRGDSTGQALINVNTSTISPNKRYYVLGNFSKYIRPGYYRVDVPPQPQANIYLTAFRVPSTNALVVVATNDNTTSTALNFSLAGVSTSSMTPFVTSGARDLSQLAAISVNGDQFSYTLDPKSVTTFVSVEGLNTSQFPLPTPTGPTPTRAPLPTAQPTSNFPSPTAPLKGPSPTSYHSPTPTSGPLQGDVNLDGHVNELDYNTVVANFGAAVCGPSQGDLNNNCTIDIFDLSLVISNFGR